MIEHAFFIILAWLFCGLISAVIATSKNLNVALWLFMGILFGPISILVVACQSSTEKVSNHSTKECPYCFGSVDIRATVCKCCSRDIDSIDENVKPENVKEDSRTDLDIQLANSAAMSDYEGCKKLISEGANLNAKDAFGLTAKDYAKGKNSTKIRRLN